MTDQRMSIVGHRVLIVVSEPWEMASQKPNDRLRGTIAAVHPFSDRVQRESILVDLPTPVVWRTTAYGSLLFEARHGEGLIDLMSERDDVECNFIGTTATQREQPTGFDIASWRGGLGGIATVRLASD